MKGKLVMSQINEEKIHAYMATEYYVRSDEKEFILKIGLISPEIKKLYAIKKQDCALFITAFNPYGQQQDDGTNLAAHQRLGAQLRSLTSHVYEGQGADPHGDWPPELSYLALGINRETAEMLGQQAHQDAVVWIGPGALPELLLLR
jgi:hypothetical protein